MIKLQQFFALKFASRRLKESHFNIKITLDEARKNGEVVTINNSELLRALFRFKNKEYNQGTLNYLLRTKKTLGKLLNNEENREKLERVTKEIEDLLFMEDLVILEFDNKAHYKAILKRNGFYVNDIRFTPFMASAGMIRRNTAMFINNSIKHQLMDILENGMDERTPMVPAKYGAYFSLYSSSTLPVSFPSFAVIPDKEIETIQRVDFVSYQGEGVDDDITEGERLLKLNAWDGQGLISPRLAEKWSRELQLNYTLSCAVIRAPFLKGMVAVFDFHQFATEVAGKYDFKDIYGIVRDIRTIDLVISESMFKLWSAYSSTESYTENCLYNQLGFSIAKVNPQRDISHSRTSYQFIQVLKLNNIDVANLCEPTINWFRNVGGGDNYSMLMYALGDLVEPEDFTRMDVATKALLLNPKVTRDPYIQSRFSKSMEKKKKESYMGSLLINANYQFMVSDPFYQACHLFNVDTPPLLKAGEHYSEYWLEKGIEQVGAIRSPIVHHSEFNVLNLQDRPDTRKWYCHIHSGVIFPANGVGMDCAVHGGADFDGDLICTINSQTMIKGRQAGLPILYESQKASKEVFDPRDDALQVEGQLRGYNSKVGFATNISSSIYTMLDEFPMGSREQETLLKRLKIGRVIQGEIIDSVKGLKVPPFRDHWTKWKKIADDMPKDEAEKQEFYNKILCEVRPAYFRFLYPHYMTRYNKELHEYDTYSHFKFGKDFSHILKSADPSEEEQRLIARYRRKTYFLDNESLVNRISRYMRMAVNLGQKYARKEAKHFDIQLLLPKEFVPTEYGLLKMQEFVSEYTSFKRLLWSDNTPHETMEGFMDYLRKKCVSEISSDERELAAYAVMVTYPVSARLKEFPWKMFPDGMVRILAESSDEPMRVPTRDENGAIEYLWDRYTIKEYDRSLL